MSATHTQPLDTSVLDAFTHMLRTLSPDDIHRHATQVHGDDLGWWHTTIEVDRRLRDARLSRRAATAAHAARDVDAELIAVARAASDAARALVAGCHLTDADSFAVSCEPVAPSDPNRGTGPSAGA